MLRLSVIAALALAPIIAPAPASAEPCACMWQEDPSFGASVGLGRAESVETGPFFSSDGATLASDAALGAGGAGAPSARAPQEVLLCISADDPRCAPRDSAPGDGPRLAESARYASGAARVPATAPPPSAVVLPRPRPRGGPRAGVRARVERPPRG